ncbi:MAG: TerC family protein [Chloroflexi bacterium]|nr:MAG: TerC family protein [Chloroflexota bacterium]
MFDGTIWLWIGFNVLVLALLALDLGVFHRDSHAVSVREAAIWSGIWIASALLFAVVIYFGWQRLVPQSPLNNVEATLAYLSGYVIEKSLSVDNIFVFVLIFSAFSVPAKFQHRVLFWGILGALVMRGIFIGVGAALLESFHWIIYVFGAFLIFTGIRMALQKETHVEPQDNPLVKGVRRFLPVTADFRGPRFFVRENGKLLATPLLLVLLAVESTDVVFAVDSIPAIFAVTTETFLVYTSNIFAILGLRSLYFVLAGMADKFYYLKAGLSVVLVFVGVKMVAAQWIHIPVALSLLVIGVVLTVAIVASLVRSRRLSRLSAQQEAARHPA